MPINILDKNSTSFNDLSIKTKEISLISSIIDELLERAIDRGNELGDTRLMLIHDQIKSFTERAKQTCTI